MKEPTLFDLIIIMLLAVSSVYAIAQLFASNLGAIVKIGITVLVIYVSARAVSSILHTSSSYGIVLIRSKRYISFIESLADRFSSIWTFLADLGLVLAFGVLSYFIIKKNSKYKLILLSIGITLIFIITFLVTPIIFPLARMLITAKEIREYQDLADKGFTQSQRSFFSLAFAISPFLGYVIATTFSLFLQSLITVLDLIRAFSGGITAQNVTPGVVPVIPGITIPLLEGIIALIVILVVHEGAHGLLCRINRVKIQSTGIALFGAVPVGAFVDPDEKDMFSRDSLTISRIVVAGPAANLFLTVILFFLMIPLLVFKSFFGINDPLFGFVVRTLQLSIVLNFGIGTINLIPLFMFDGYYLVNANVNNKELKKVIFYTTLIMFLIIVLPIFFRL